MEGKDFPQKSRAHSDDKAIKKVTAKQSAHQSQQEKADEQIFNISLPLSLPDQKMNMKGPTEWSNWVFPERILAGALPKNAEIVSELLKAGISTFVCMVTEDELKRQGKHYFEIVKSLVSEYPKEFPTVSLKKLQYIHVPIYGTAVNFVFLNYFRDKGVLPNEDLVKLLDDLVKRFLAGERLFIHCKGGHGRTGVVVSCLLSKIYGLTAYDALELCQEYHDYRGDVEKKGKGTYSSPETHEQKSQVYKILSFWGSNSSTE